MKYCNKCKKTKPFGDFYPRRGAKCGLQGWCIECHNASSQARSIKKNAATADNGTEYRKAGSLRYLYGLSLAQYKKMLTEQGGVCAICGNPETISCKGKVQPLSVDHCHKTGKIRGLLCHRCNTGIGMLGDDLDLLASAVSYLTNSRI